MSGLYRIGVLISGRGSNFKAIAENIKAGYIRNAEIVVVISNRSNAGGLDIARSFGIEALFVDPEGLSRQRYDEQLIKILKQYEVNLVVLAGFMRILTPSFIEAFRDRIVNIHPALLPSFKGLHAQRQALQAGVRFAGATVHFVTEEMDSGPIIVQSVVPVLCGDTEETLSKRILRTEHKIYPYAIKLITEGKLRIENGRVIYDSEELPDEFFAINPTP